MGSSPNLSDPVRGLLHASVLLLLVVLVTAVAGAFLDALWLLLTLQLGVVGAGTAWWISRLEGGWRRAVGEVPGRPWAYAAALVIALALVALQTPVLDAWADLTGTAEPQWYREVVRWDSVAGLALVLLAIAVVPPICEELFFRGYLLARLREIGTGRAVFLQALIFTLWHAHPYGVPAYFAAGLLLGAIRVRAGSLGPAIVLHAVNNALGIWEIRTGVSLWERLIG